MNLRRIDRDWFFLNQWLLCVSSLPCDSIAADWSAKTSIVGEALVGILRRIGLGWQFELAEGASSPLTWKMQ
jgi:hypothetical protein